MASGIHSAFVTDFTGARTNAGHQPQYRFGADVDPKSRGELLEKIGRDLGFSFFTFCNSRPVLLIPVTPFVFLGIRIW